MAPPRVPGGRRASTCGGGGSRWLQVAPALARQGGVGSRAGPERGEGCAPGAGWAAPRCSDPGGRLLPGRCARPAPPAPALSPPLARPGPAPGPAAYCSNRGAGGPARRCAPGESLWRRGGAAVTGEGGRVHSRAASPPCLPGGRGRGSRAGKGGLGGLVRLLQVRRWLHSSGAGRGQSPPPQPSNTDPRSPPPRPTRGLDPGGEREGCGGSVEKVGSPRGGCWGALTELQQNAGG